MRQKIVVVSVLVLTILLGLFSCKNNLLLTPVVSDKSTSSGDTVTGSVFGTPTGFTASHGIKGSVELRWEAVRGAARYNVYAVTTPSETPVKIDSVTGISCFIAEKAGSSRYYRITAVSHAGKETDPTLWQLGTTLARPQITSITPKDGEETSSVIVTWWMSNLFDYNETYEKSVKYKVFIKEEATDKELDPVDATGVSAEITGLSSKTKYLFRVVSYLSLNPQATEESDWIDQETARRMKPQAPQKVSASQGTSASDITLNWTIPSELVEYPAGEGAFTTHPLFFKIYRRASGDKVWNELKVVKPTTELPGDSLSWKDDAVATRIRYEYKIQSFAEVKTNEVSSDSSASETIGWIFNKATFRIDSSRNKDTKEVKVTFIIDWNNFGVNEDKYKVQIKTEKKEFDVSEALWENHEETDLLSFDSAANLIYPYQFTDNKYYKYTMIIKETGSQSVMQSQTSIPVAVTEKYVPETPVFTVREGWSDKIEITYTLDSLVEDYKLRRTSETEPVPFDISVRNESPDGSKATFIDSGLVSGEKYMYQLLAVCEGNEIPFEVKDAVSAAVEFKTLGTPVPTFEETRLDYTTVTVTWKGVPLANAAQPYKVLYNYEGQGNRLEASLPQNFLPDGEGTFTLTFTPDQFDNANFSGKNIEVAVVAQSHIASSPESKVIARILGPALTDLRATQAKYTDKIDVTWKAVPGANGYLITRTLVGSSPLKTDQYYVSMNNSVILQAQPDPISLTDDFVSVYENNGTYTLTDKLKINISSTEPSKEGYYERQSRMAWGNEYAYSVVPLKGTDIASPVAYKNKTMASASVLGYGLNVTATKARAARSVRIIWDNPPHVPANAVYTLYRSKEGEQSYTPVNTAVQTPGKREFTDGMRNTNGDFSAEFAKEAYTYLVGISLGGAESNPRIDTAFRKSFGETDQSINFGYTLNAPVITDASKGDNADLNKNYAENIKWNAPVAGENPRGAQGYEIEIRNYNLNNNTERDGWYLLETVSGTVPPSNGKTYNKDEQVGGKPALKVLRDYKHYYRIRAYNGDGDDRVYSDYSNEVWGARQITNEEFAKFALINMSIGWEKTRGDSGSSKDKSYSVDKKVVINSPTEYQGATDYKIYTEYSNYHSTIKPRGSSQEVETVIINGSLNARGGLAGQYPWRYWTDAPHVAITYLGKTGTIEFDGDGSKKGEGSTTQSSGFVKVIWNSESIQYSMSANPKAFNIPLPFSGPGYLNDTEEWK